MRAATFAAALAVAAMATPAGAAVHVFTTHLSGGAEAPPNLSPGSGFARVTVDDVALSMLVNVTFADLVGTTTASHIHGLTALPGQGIAMVATELPSFENFPLGVHAGSYEQVFDMSQASSYNPAFITAHGGTTATAFADLLAGMQARRTYLNVHTSFAPGGEVRGFLSAIPEPKAWGLMLAGFGLAGAALRRRVRKLTAPG